MLAIETIAKDPGRCLFIQKIKPVMEIGARVLT
jgi:hypothetical protein